jgi:hypothetical protein
MWTLLRTYGPFWTHYGPRVYEPPTDSLWIHYGPRVYAPPSGPLLDPLRTSSRPHLDSPPLWTPYGSPIDPLWTPIDLMTPMERSTLKRHLLTHADYHQRHVRRNLYLCRNHVLTHRKSFARSSGLTDHAHTHSDEKPYSCSVSAGKHAIT